MKTIISLVLFLIIGLIASRGLFTRVKSRLPVTVLWLTGIEFLFLGVLLGPQFLDLITERVLQDLTPVAYLALGWAGLLFGTQLSRRHLRRLSKGVFTFLLMDAVGVTLLVSGVLFVALARLFPELPVPQVWSSALVLAVAAAVSSPTIVAVLARILPSRGNYTRLVRVLTSLSPVIPLLAFGLIFTLVHPGLFVTEGIWSGIAWWVFANAVGIVMGFAFALFVAQRMSRDERLLVIMGTALFVGGMCYFLRLSALYTSMIMGVVMGNFSRRRVQIFEQLLSMEKTIYVAFLILIGAMISITRAEVAWIIAIYVTVRLVAKVFVSSWAVRRNFPDIARPGLSSGLAFSAQGGVALAVALDYGLGTRGMFVSDVVAIIAASVVVNEALGVGLTRRAFIASGEVRARKVQRSTGEGVGG